MEKATVKKIMFSGGGSGGPVMPLLAVAEELLRANERPTPEFVFVGTYGGPEREMVASFNKRLASGEAASGEGAEPLRFTALLSGKLRRYFSLANFFDIFKVIVAYFQAHLLLLREKPDLVVTAGGFVSVPLAWAAAGRKIPILVHQQDVRPGLANKLMAPFARAVTVTFEKSLTDYGSRAVWLGNPLKDLAGEEFALSVSEDREKYSIDGAQPLVLVTGGATGSTALNRLIRAAAPELAGTCRIIHLTGRGKLTADSVTGTGGADSYYIAKDFVSNGEILALIAAADLVVSRCGLSVLTELSALDKPAILIPMPASHQEDNAAVFARASAAIVLAQAGLTPDQLVAEIKRGLSDSALRAELKKNIGRVIRRGAAATMAGLIWEIVK